MINKDYSKYSFFITPKLVVFNESLTEVLLARRKGEADYDGTFSFIGGKLEQTDEDLLAGMLREKTEEIGESAQVEIDLESSKTVFYRRKDGQMVLVPHYPVVYSAGKIELNEEEYSEFSWVKLADLKEFEPKIDNIYSMAIWAKSALSSSS